MNRLTGFQIWAKDQWNNGWRPNCD